MMTSAEVAASGCDPSVVHGDAKAHRRRLLVCLALAAVAMFAPFRMAQGAPRRPTSLLEGGQIRAYGQRSRSCQDRLTMSVSPNQHSGDYAMCCREFKPIPLFPEELVEAKVKLSSDEDLLQVKLEDDNAYLFLQDGPAKAGVIVFRKPFTSDNQKPWMVKKLCVVAAGDYAPNRIEILSAQVIGPRCSTIRSKSTLQADDDSRWTRAIDSIGLHISDEADLTAAVRVKRPGRGDHKVGVTAEVELRTRDDVVVTGHGEGNEAIAHALSDAIARIRAATTDVTIHTTVPEAEIVIVQPVSTRGVQSLTVGCIATAATIIGRAAAPGYTTHEISLTAAYSREADIDLVPTSAASGAPCPAGASNCGPDGKGSGVLVPPSGRQAWMPVWLTIALVALVVLLLALIALRFVVRWFRSRRSSTGSRRDVGRADCDEPLDLSGRNKIAVIGIDQYKHQQRLTNAVSDAKSVAELFQKCGFELVAKLLDEQATTKALWDLVMDDGLSKNLEKNDNLILFYAGHGDTREDAVGKIGYLAPFDASQIIDGTWIKLDSWLETVARLRAKHILVILDACHSGIALGPIIKMRSATLRAEALLALRKHKSRRVITSALHDQKAFDMGPIAGHSLFAGYLIEGLNGDLSPKHGNVTTGTEIGLYLQWRVTEYSGSRQTPDFGAFQFDDRGDMVIPLAVEMADTNHSGTSQK